MKLRAKRSVHQSLTPLQRVQLEYHLCSKYPLYWLRRYGYILNEQTGKEYGPGLKLWSGTDDWPEGQPEYAEQYAAGVNINLLKGRREGASWIAENLDTWDLMFESRVRLGIIDKRQLDAFKHIERMRRIYNKQPPFLKRRKIMRGKDRKDTFALGTSLSDYSLIESHVCTKAAFRGEGMKRVRLEELAFYPNADDVLTSVLSASSDSGGQIVIISTGNGEGTVHHGTWLRAVSGQNSFKPIFWPWYMHPYRGPDWYERTRRDYPSEAKFRQEHPSTPEEAFMASGSKYFDREDLQACYVKREPLRRIWGWSIYTEPRKDGVYVIGADPSDGGGDACSADVLDAATGDQVAHYHDFDIGAGGFADVLDSAGRQYNNALIIVERNNHGHKVCERLASTHKYPRLYHHEPDDKAGHPTDKVSRPSMLVDMAGAFQDRAVTVHDSQTFAECAALAWIRDKPQAPEKMHDDAVFSLGKSIIGIPYARSCDRRPRGRSYAIH